MSAKNGGVQTPPPLLVSQKSEIGLPPLPPLSEKIRNWLTPPPPLVADVICEWPLRAHQKHVLLKFRAQQTAHIGSKVVVFAIFTRITANKVKLIYL